MQKSNNVTINADPNDQVNIKADIEPFAGDVAREYAKQAKASAENAASSESFAASESAAKDSETAAASSASAAASSAESAKESENAAVSSATAAKNSENAAAASAKDAHDVAAAVGNPVADVTEVNGKVTVTKSNGDKNEFFAGLNMLQRNKAYAVGDIAYSPNLKSYEYLECITAGTTGDTEPDFSTVTTGGVINDGGSVWKVCTVANKENTNSEIEKLKQIISDLQTKIENQISDENNFAIVDFGTIQRGNRYTKPNPFPGYHVLCITELYMQKKWANSDSFIYSAGGFGTHSGQLLPDDIIVVQTGGKSIVAGGSQTDGGTLFPTSCGDIASGHCRVIVYKLGKIEE